jgi:hypothetical protein
MKTEFMTKVSRSLNKVGFKIKKHSPEILIVAGTVGAVASAVMACKATLKVNEIVEEAKETVDKIHEGVEEQKKLSDGTEYTQEMANKDLLIVYAQTGWKFVKLYGPSVALGVMSIGCMIGSNQILRKRNVALAAAFKAIDTNFKEYRGRVVERFGEKLDRELRYNIKAKEVEEVVVDEEGNETVVKKTVEVMDPNSVHNIYSIIFDDGNTGWSKNAELNKVFLIQQQEAANFRLKTQGVLTLNEVYDMLGAPRTAYGQIAGWVYTGDGTAGDDFVDFGIFDIYNENARDFVNLREKTIILDFNCIGNILEYM